MIVLDVLFCDATVNLAHKALHREDEHIQVTGKRLTIVFPSGERIDVPFDKIVTGGRAAYRFFYSSLRWLKSMNALHSFVRKSTSEIIVELGNKYEPLFKLLDSFHGINIGVFTYTHYKILMFINVFPAPLDIRSISMFLTISGRGAEKIIDKLRRMGLITEEIKLTELGRKMLSLCRSSKPSLADIVMVELVPSGTCTLFSAWGLETLHNISEYVSDMIEHVFLRSSLREMLRDRPICILGICYNRHISDVVENLSSRLSKHSSVVGIPLVYSKTMFYDRIIIPSHYTGTRTLSKIMGKGSIATQHEIPRCDISLNDIQKLKRFILRKLQENYIIILLAPRIFCLQLNHSIAMEYAKAKTGKEPSLEILKLKLSLIEITRLSSDILNLRNDFDAMINDSDKLLFALLEALGSNRRITIRWNIDTDTPSWLEIIPKSIIQRISTQSLVMSSSSHRIFAIELPLGKVQLFNLAYLVRRGALDLRGKIYLLGEPIYGLKHRFHNWPWEHPDKPEAEITIESKNGEIRLLVEKTQYDYLKPILSEATIFGIDIGVNQYIRKPRKLDPIIASKTKNFMDIIFQRPGIVDPNTAIPDHFLATNAEIYIDDKRIWRTPPIPKIE